MKSVDTNILARYVMHDDPLQNALAVDVLQQPCFITDTVLVETAWLLSSRFGVPRQKLSDILRDLVSLPTVTVDAVELVNWAVDRFAAGADFADMMHVIASRRVEAFVSFEKNLARLAGPDTPVPVETLG